MKPMHSPFSNNMFYVTNSSPIVIVNLDFIIIDVNKAALKILKYNLDELLQKNISEFSEEEDSTVSAHQINELLSGEIMNYSIIRKFHLKGKKLVNLDIRVSVVIDEQTNVKYLSCTFQKLNITQASSEFNFKTDTLNSIIDKSPIIQYVLDLKKDLNIYENRSLISYLGYTPEDMEDKSEFEFLDSLVDEESYDNFKNTVRKYKESNNPKLVLEIEYKTKNKAGNDVWLYDKSVALKVDQHGKKVLSYGIIIDITERKENEEKIEEQSKLLNKISDSIPEFIYITSSDDKQLFFHNKKLKSVLGYLVKDLKLTIKEEILHPAFFAEYEKKYSNFLNSKTSKGYEVVTKLKHKTKGYRWYKMRHFVFERNENGTPSKVLKIVIDVNEKIKEKIDSSEKDWFIKNVSSKLPSNVYVKDLKTGNILFSNVDKHNKLGYTIAEWQNNFNQIIHPGHLELLNSKMRNFLFTNQNTSVGMDVLLKLKKVGYRWYNFKVKVFKRDIYNEPLQILEILEDIHEVKLKTNKIKEQQTLIKSITDSIDSYMYLYNTKLNEYTFSNFENREILGYSKEDFLKNHESFAHPDYLTDLYAIKEAAYSKTHEPKYEIEILIKHKNNGYVWINVTVLVLSIDQNGFPDQILRIIEDINESKTRVIKINEQQKLIEKISTSIPEFIYLKNTKNNQLIFSNNKAIEIFGYNDSEFVTNWEEYVHPDDKQRIIEYNNAIIHSKSDSQFILEIRIRHKTKGYFWCLNKTIVFERNKNNIPIKTLELVSDINDYKLTNSRLEEQQKFIENISLTIPQFLSVYDLVNKKSIYTNYDNKLIFGYTKDEFLINRGKLIHPNERESVIARIDSITVNDHLNQSKPLEFKLFHKTKGYVWVRLKRLVTERDKNGKAMQALEILENIDEAKKSYIQILDQQNFIQKVAITIPNIIQVTDVLRNEAIYSNFENRIFLGYNKKEWLQTKMNIIHKDHYDTYVSDVQKLIYANKDIITNHELLIKTKTGEYKWVLVINSAFKVGPEQVIQIITIFRDINNRKELQLKLERQVSINVELERFAAITSHDLKEPLRTLSNYAQILQSEYENELDEMGKDLLHHITSGSKRMGELINDILDFSKVQTEGSKFQRIDLDEILKTVLLDLKENISSTKTLINTEKMPVVLGDKTQLRQVFQNLISNALKFTQNENPIINIGLIDEDTCYKFYVQDNGIGIRKIDQSNIFGVFKKLHRENEYEGQGIGLSICKRIVERHEGKIWLESEENVGTTFYFTIPKLGF